MSKASCITCRVWIEWHVVTSTDFGERESQILGYCEDDAQPRGLVAADYCSVNWRSKAVPAPQNDDAVAGRRMSSQGKKP